MGMTDWLAPVQQQLAALMPMVGGAVGVAVLLYVATTTLTTLSVPGMLIPISITGGALVGPGPAILAVAGGGLTGSLLLFLLITRFGTARLHHRFGDRLQGIEDRFGKLGPWAVAGLRVAGVPAPLVAAGAALTHMRPSLFALATLAGLLPSVVLAATGSSALLG